MPILKSEPSLFPENLFQGEETGTQCWWALYTMSRQEKTLMRYLFQRQISYYCPIVPNQYRSPAGRQRVSHLPLFSNYVFLRGEEEDRVTALSSGNVSRILPILEPARFQDQLRSIFLSIEAGRPLTIESDFQPGDLVRVKRGALTGAVGTVIQRRGERRLLLAVEFMQQCVSVSIEDWETEPMKSGL